MMLEYSRENPNGKLVYDERKKSDKFDGFTEKEKELILQGLIMECKSYRNYGLNGFTDEGKTEYNDALRLLKELDKECGSKFEYVYEDWEEAELGIWD